MKELRTNTFSLQEFYEEDKLLEENTTCKNIKDEFVNGVKTAELYNFVYSVIKGSIKSFKVVKHRDYVSVHVNEGIKSMSSCVIEVSKQKAIIKSISSKESLKVSEEELQEALDLLHKGLYDDLYLENKSFYNETRSRMKTFKDSVSYRNVDTKYLEQSLKQFDKGFEEYRNDHIDKRLKDFGLEQELTV